MKITVKTTQQKVYQVDVEPSDTIGSLKEKIESLHGHAVASQKIIYSGKILPDDKTVDSCGIKEKDFLVLMVSKPKPSAASTSTSTPAPSTQKPSTPAPAPVAAAPAPPAQESTPAPAVAAPAEAPAAPSSTDAFNNSGSFLTGGALQAAVANLVEMGFPADQVNRAMRASFNNPDRAAEYLMTGIPAHLLAETAPAAPQPPTSPSGGQAPAQTPASPAAQAAPAAAPAAPAQPQNLFQLAQQQQQQQQQHAHGGGFGGGALNLEAIRNSPQIRQLRNQLHSNPEGAQHLIQQLAAQNPGIAQMIAQNPDVLADLLDVEGDFGEGEDGQHPPPGSQFVEVTPEERAAIQRLVDLGFSSQAAIEAYLACDKNEELAANYLFENAFDD